MNTSTETVKDNQWWFSKSSLRSLVEQSSLIELQIGGRRCVLRRSAVGTDGRETFSFRFVRDDDLMYWRSLNGTSTLIEVINNAVLSCDVEDDQEDESLQLDNMDCHSPNMVLAESEVSHDRRIVLDDTLKLLFDAYIFVDWSASSVPKRGKDSIWIAEGHWVGRELNWGTDESTCFNAPTREIATQRLRERLRELHRENKRVLVCFDFAYCYPQCDESKKFATDFGQLAARLHEIITDEHNNGNNRFRVANGLNHEVNAPSGEGPFWGRPVTGYAAQLEFLRQLKPLDWSKRKSLKEFRVVEERLRNKGKRPFSVWQLFGNGSVGSQVLVGLPRVHSLRNDQELASHSRVWPFETGWVTSFTPEIRIVHAEFWPGAIEVDESLHPVRDASQVLSCVKWAASLDSLGRLGAFFDPIRKDDQERELAMKEGWILGFMDN